MKNLLYGAIVGDCCGVYYESRPCKCADQIQLIKPANKFSDDTICTIAIADAIIKYDNPTSKQFAKSLQYWCKKYPDQYYGKMFKNWIDNPEPYNSFGNGSAMRVSPCGFYAKNEAHCIELATNSAICSHNHSKGIIGAIVTALAVYYANHNQYEAKIRIKGLIQTFYPTYANYTLDDIRPTYRFDSTCPNTVPVALMAFLESESYEDCITLAIAMGGDADTLAAIAGSIAYAYYLKMNRNLMNHITELLPEEIIKVVNKFDNK